MIKVAYWIFVFEGGFNVMDYEFFCVVSLRLLPVEEIWFVSSCRRKIVLSQEFAGRRIKSACWLPFPLIDETFKYSPRTIFCAWCAPEDFDGTNFNNLWCQAHRAKTRREKPL